MARRLTPRGEQRRSELLAFATARFAENGYHPTSVAELVDGLGVGKGVFYWYFESKEDLFLEILRTGEQELRRAQLDASTGESDPLRRLELGLLASMRWWADHHDLYTLIQFAATEASFADSVRKGHRVAVNDTKRLVQEAIDGGLIVDADAEVSAQAIMGVSTALARTQLLRERRPPEEVAAQVLDFCLHGLLGRAEPSRRVRAS